MKIDNERIAHQFVEFIPAEILEKVFYISILYCTATHKCFCGCGIEVVTPFSPTDWSLIFDGENVTLSPSIGNWSFACKSHYWIKSSMVVWADSWSEEQIQSNRKFDRSRKIEKHSSQSSGLSGKKTPVGQGVILSLWAKFRKKLGMK